MDDTPHQGFKRVIGRREASLAGVALWAGLAPAAPAQGQGGPGRAGAAPVDAVLPLPVPCVDRPGDLTGFLLEGFGSPPGTVAVLGQAFRPGDLPRGTGLAARTANGRPVPAQLDVSVRHPDGSVRFGILSLALPAIGRGDRLGIILSRAAAAPATPLDLSALFAGRSAVLTLTPAGGGEAWRLDLLRATAEGAAWQSGPLAVQRRVSAEVPAAVAGATSLRVVADIAARADGTIWVDLWFRNDIAMRQGGGRSAYSARLALDGQEVLRAELQRHFQYTGWGRLVGASPGGRPPPVQPVVRPDTLYLSQTGAIAHYDLSTGVAEEVLSGLARQMAEPAWAQPLGNRQITKYMDEAGARSDIGATTLQQAAWLTSGDPRAALFCIGQAEAAGSVPWHMWDPRGGWLDQPRWPRLWYDERAAGAASLVPLAQPISSFGESGWYAEPSHQPDLCFVPYLLTGRRAFLDELQAQAAWNVLVAVPGPRDAEGAARGVNVINDRQVRSAAWAMRQLGEAAWISPAENPQAAYFQDVVRRNWAWLRASMASLTGWQGEAHGWLVNFGFSREITIFQQDYFASTAAAAARHGSEDAKAVLAWMANFLVGRFLSERRGFPRNDGAVFVLMMAEPPPQGGAAQPYRSWAEIAAATRAGNASNGAGWERTTGEQARLAMQSLALLQDVLAHPGARQAYLSLLSTNPPPGVAPQDHASWPTQNVVPRDLPRLPERLVRCGPTARG